MTPGFQLSGMSPPRAVAMTKKGAVLFTVDFGRPTPWIGCEMDFNVVLTLSDAGKLSRISITDALLQLRDAVKQTLALFEPLL